MNPLGRSINVLVVDDSPVVRDFLTHVLTSDPEIRVIATAPDGAEAVAIVRSKKPDVITMDIHMPKMDGLEATRQIMETQPTPIVIVSGSASAQEVATTFRAIQAGALAVVARPQGIGHPRHIATVNELIQTVKLMSEVRVVRRWPRRGHEPAPPFAKDTAADVQLVAMGASTGGPLVLQSILSALPKDFAAPIVIVQHIALGFVGGFVEWLAESSGFPVRLAVDGDRLRPGQAYVAPDGAHMGVTADGRITLSPEASAKGLRPAVSHLFRSVANAYGPKAVGVLLTGMGEDGAEELRRMKEHGAVTLVQDAETSVVFGMPGAAVKIDAATSVLSPDKIAAALAALVTKSPRAGHRR